MIFLNLATQNTIETKKRIIYLARQQVEMGTACLMTSFRDVILSCKYDDNNQVEFSQQKNNKNKNKISSRAHLQAEIKKVCFLMSRSKFNDVMTSRYDMKTSCKYIHDDSLEPINRNVYRNTCVSSF